MLEKFQRLPLRNGVGIVLLNKSNQVFVARRIDNPSQNWQMPQGGVDNNESYYDAAIRELKEETSIRNIALLKEIDELITYELPNNLLGIIWKGKFRGQKQKWFIFRFEGDETEINVKTQKPEFLEWKWINLEDITKVVVKFKLNVYTKIQQHVKDLLSKQRN